MVRTVSVADRLSVVQSARYIRATRAGRSSGVEGGTMTASGDEQAAIKARALRTREGQLPASETGRVSTGVRRSRPSPGLR